MMIHLILLILHGLFFPTHHQSVQFSHSVVSDSLLPHGLQHTRLSCPSPTPGACSDTCPSSPLPLSTSPTGVVCMLWLIKVHWHIRIIRSLQFTWGLTLVVHSVGLHKCTVTCMLHHSIIYNVFIALKIQRRGFLRQWNSSLWQSYGKCMSSYIYPNP